VGGNATIKANVRIVAATNRDLEAATEAGTFRPDLFDRLNVLPLLLPPLRARRGDIPELARHFLRQIAAANERPEPTLSADALGALTAYSYPGNVRELRNVMERLVILTPDATIDASDVQTCLGSTAAPAARGLYRPGVPYRVLCEETERTILSEALRHHDDQMASTARALDLERSHFYKKCKALGLRE
jgi:hypothetical protein